MRSSRGLNEIYTNAFQEMQIYNIRMACILDVEYNSPAHVSMEYKTFASYKLLQYLYSRLYNCANFHGFYFLFAFTVHFMYNVLFFHRC